MASHTYDDTVVLPNLKSQQPLATTTDISKAHYCAENIDTDTYDHIVICMSGGKDSIACLLHIQEMGADMTKVELWHHVVDGREGSQLMDWPFMSDYNRQLAAVFKIPLYFSWLEGGFEGEMLKVDSYSRPHKIETHRGILTLERDKRRAKPATRLMFPQQGASLASRWCTSSLKIDVGRRALNNQERFCAKKVLFITGERRQESPNRAKYNQLERHACDRRNGRKARHVDAWRPVLNWSEERVWDIFRRNNIIAPVPYRLGWGRSSCMTCIFNGPKIWATIAHYFPDRAQNIAAFEERFEKTISRKRINVLDLGATTATLDIEDVDALEQAIRTDYTLPLLLPDGDIWKAPPRGIQ